MLHHPGQSSVLGVEVGCWGWVLGACWRGCLRLEAWRPSSSMRRVQLGPLVFCLCWGRHWQAGFHNVRPNRQTKGHTHTQPLLILGTGQLWAALHAQTTLTPPHAHCTLQGVRTNGGVLFMDPLPGIPHGCVQDPSPAARGRALLQPPPPLAGASQVGAGAGGTGGVSCHSRGSAVRAALKDPTGCGADRLASAC